MVSPTLLWRSPALYITSEWIADTPSKLQFRYSNYSHKFIADNVYFTLPAALALGVEFRQFQSSPP